MRVVQWVLLVLGLAFCAYRVLPRAWNAVNTDFPNYYVTARLLREGSSVDRVYEWEWFARQKDRMAVTQPLAGFIPHTPLSALVLWPIAELPPLEAKHVWIVCNVIMLAAALVLLSRISEVSWRWAVIAALYSIPFYRNLEYGQLYVLLLLLVTLALWAYIRGWRAAAGVLVGVAGALKIFPLLFLLYFVRRRDWRAVVGCILACAASAVFCAMAFGTNVSNTFFEQVLPWALRGEGNDPYNLAANSISALLHHLLLYEPELNPHPLWHAPRVFAVVQPVLQNLLLAPFFLLFAPDGDERRISLEWGALLTAILAVSTMPASYHFVLLLLPLLVWGDHYHRRGQYRYLAAICVLCFLAGWPLWPHAVLTPRLWVMLLLLLLLAAGLRQRQLAPLESPMPWVALFVVLCGIQIVGMMKHVRGVEAAQKGRVMTSPQIFSIAAPTVKYGTITFAAMTVNGWRLARLSPEGVLHLEPSSFDQLSPTSVSAGLYGEEVGATSTIWFRSSNGATDVVERNAQQPIVSSDESRLAFLRTDRGRASLWMRQLDTGVETRVSSIGLDVYEASFTPDRNLIFAAARDHHLGLYVSNGRDITPLNLADARYPALSPDGRWLAYSRLDRGTWHLTVRDLATNQQQRVNTADCNDLSPQWLADSKSLLYTSDCGRALHETALYLRRVVP